MQEVETEKKSSQLFFIIGSLIVYGGKLQVYFLWKVISGGIILGIFPGLLGVYRFLCESITKRSIPDMHLLDEMKKFNKNEFLKINLLGYLSLLGSLILALNLNISKYYIQSWPLHIMLILLAILFFGTSLYIIPIFARYELSFQHYITQSFLFFLLNILEGIAGLMGVFVIAIVCLFVPALAVFAGIPFLLLPYAWFSMVAVKKVEARFYNEEVVS